MCVCGWASSYWHVCSRCMRQRREYWHSCINVYNLVPDQILQVLLYLLHFTHFSPFSEQGRKQANNVGQSNDSITVSGLHLAPTWFTRIYDRQIPWPGWFSSPPPSYWKSIFMIWPTKNVFYVRWPMQTRILVTMFNHFFSSLSRVRGHYRKWRIRLLRNWLINTLLCNIAFIMALLFVRCHHKNACVFKTNLHIKRDFSFTCVWLDV